MTLAPGSVFAGHRIESIAGRGGMGVVYKATHLALEITVALKVIAPELAEDASFRERFKRESRLAASIEHPHIIPIRHAGEDEGQLYVTMRYAKGTDLAALIAERGRLDPRLAATIIAQVGGALSAAHEAGLVHRDVKPANVLLEDSRSGVHAYLTDFGLTRQQVGDQRLTMTGQWVGTLGYVSPEQITSTEADGRADVYSLGCVVYEALSGRPPFEREGEVATLYAHLEEASAPLAGRVEGVTPALDAAIAQAMAKQPADRFQSAEELGRAVLEATGASRPPPPPPPGPAAATTPPAPQLPPEPGVTEPAGEDPRERTTRLAQPAARSVYGSAPKRAARLRLVALLGGLAAAVIAAIALLGGGDGGGGEGGAGPTESFQVRADAICAETESEVEGSFSEIEAEAGEVYDELGRVVLSPEMQAQFFDRRAKIVAEGLERLGELEPAAAMQPAFDGYISLLDELAAETANAANALESGDVNAAVAAMARMRELDEQKRDAGLPLGFYACAERLPRSDREEVAALASAWITGSDADQVCRSQVTATLIKALFEGSPSRCAADQRTAPLATTAVVVERFGVTGVVATVSLRVSEGELPVFFDHEDGRWKVDGVGVLRS